MSSSNKKQEWSNEGDLVFSPFTGIGSEGVGALTLNRRFDLRDVAPKAFEQELGPIGSEDSRLLHGVEVEKAVTCKPLTYNLTLFEDVACVVSKAITLRSPI